MSIDGAAAIPYDLYAPAQHWKVGKAFTGLSAGGHTLRITVLGAKSASSTGTGVVVDAVVVHS